MTFRLGSALRVQLFGESHGTGVGCIVEGLPPGTPLTMKEMQVELDKRRPGVNRLTSPRQEPDKLQVLGGLLNGKTTDTPLALFIQNQDVKSGAYKKQGALARPGHADFPAHARFGKNRDARGGGAFSGRLTAPLVAAGVAAQKLLQQHGARVAAHVVQIGSASLKCNVSDKELLKKEGTLPVNCVDENVSNEMEKEIQAARADGDSVGGVIEGRVIGLPPGIGEPFFDSVEAVLSHGMFSIPAVKGVEFGAGFRAAQMRGSQHNDPLRMRRGKVVNLTNNAGGALGGLTTGATVVFRVAIKPTSSIFKPQKTVDLKKQKNATLKLEGRHDPCIAIRATPVVKAVAALCMADLCLQKEAQK